ncbi:hydrolase [Bacillus canaveralius]|uniref:Hydrolase n=1 Tax=Bacillus canaveralius TaxID=1403243 RepID=A0A2N5GPE0_9BACI|nr:MULTISPECIES: hydrolase [Bacillus]PLR84439.1 hydrolase [Bacillus canaveralius]PLR86976.1 hydrolase [Bacillus sp. V33-4]PLS00559.1 hydrolase [Bacillus canaveralius]RSK57844.1 hydrolase [Bacillus canaveralius]
MDKSTKTYYISVGTGEISQSSTASPWNFQIHATDEEITILREYFEQNYSTEWQNFFRAHVPYVQYHYDRENDAYDETMKKIYGMIYELGDEQAKNHIEEMGILTDKN